MELREIGAYDDEVTGLRGVRRLALTDADAEARRCCRVRFDTDMLGSAVTAPRHGVQIAWERTAKDGGRLHPPRHPGPARCHRR